MSAEQPILALKNLTKEYPGVIALNNFNASFLPGEVHALIGENGAGKSTMIKSIAGAIEPTSGEILVDGKAYKAMTPHLSREFGIEVVYQEFNLVEPLTAAENICFGEKTGKLYSQKEACRRAKEVFDIFGIDINPMSIVSELSTARKQVVEIAKAVSKNVRILILDEPTAPLTVTETEHLFEIIEKLKADGVTVLFISHRLDEIFRICDRVTVMRDGSYVTTLNVADTTRQELIALMVGRELTETYPPRNPIYGEESIRVEGITTEDITNISFSARKGEILGISGLVGSGRTETAKAIFGADKRQAGDIYIHGKKVNIREPKDAIAAGIGLIPEDRKLEGVFLRQTILWNSSIVNIKNISKGLIVDTKEEKRIAQHFRDKMRIRTPSLVQTVSNLSGGNQQKVVITKTLSANSDIIIFDEPTRGIDVGARYEIYLLMNDLASEGKTILMITSDMEELLGMSDRVIVFHEGKLAGELPREEFSQNRILAMASGEETLSAKEG